jgi:hypothetical protein
MQLAAILSTAAILSLATRADAAEACLTNDACKGNSSTSTINGTVFCCSGGGGVTINNDDCKCFSATAAGTVDQAPVSALLASIQIPAASNTEPIAPVAASKPAPSLRAAAPNPEDDWEPDCSSCLALKNSWEKNSSNPESDCKWSAKQCHNLNVSCKTEGVNVLEEEVHFFCAPHVDNPIAYYAGVVLGFFFMAMGIYKLCECLGCNCPCGKKASPDNKATGLLR